jgi:Gas vesicle synthesis protein GvpL/GvpF
VIHLYAIAEPGPPVALEELRHGDLCGIYSHHGDREPTLAALERHERVVEDVMAVRTLLPARFGSVLGGEDDLRAMLDERAAEFREALALVRDRVEIGVRARPRTVPELPPPETGRAYVERKLARLRAARAVQADMHDALAARAHAAVARALAEPEPQFTGAYLIDRETVDSFRARVEEVADGREVVCTGPWPPYSFVGDAQRG